MNNTTTQKNPVKNEFQLRVRFFGRDIRGDITLARAFLTIKGVSYAIGNALMQMNKDIVAKKIGEFSVDEITMLEDKIRADLRKIPVWLMNKRIQPFTGKNEHIIMSDLDFFEKQILDAELESKSRKAIRRSRKLTVRGQKTHTSGRINRIKQQTRKKDLRHRKFSAKDGVEKSSAKQANQPTKDRTRNK